RLPRRRGASRLAGRGPDRRRLALRRGVRTHHRRDVRAEHGAASASHREEPRSLDMSKATVLVRLKSEVLDPQGDAVKRALAKLGCDGARGVRIGKLIEIDLGDAPVADAAALKARLAKMADDMLANPVIEEFEVQVASS